MMLYQRPRFHQRCLFHLRQLRLHHLHHQRLSLERCQNHYRRCFLVMEKQMGYYQTHQTH